jgi:NAD(P)-dependent dehydrogenase (short-subunit alcohol dehydrogenase family)
MQELAARGCKLVLCARDPEELSIARRELEARGAEVLAVPCDIGDRASVERLVEKATDHFGRIDILINNAGVLQVGPLHTMTVEDFEEAMAANFWGAVYALSAVLPQMRRRRFGRIVNVTSIGGKVAMPHLAPYNASKFALLGLSESMRAELAVDGIGVTTVVPGLMRTGSALNALFRGEAREEFRWFASCATYPITSIDARGAAARIVRACQRGEAYVTLGLQAKILRALHDVAPGAVARALSIVNRWLPSAAGRPTELVRGSAVADAVPPSVEERLERAARSTNQRAGVRADDPN